MTRKSEKRGRFWGEERDDEWFEAQRIRDQALLFTPSLPCLRWMSLSCVGEFTVFCNLIPNKVTQQILLSQMDAAELSLFFFALKRQLKQDTMRRCFLHRLCICRLGWELYYWSISPHLHLLLTPLLPLSLLPFYFFPSELPHTYICLYIPRMVTSEQL